MTEKRYKVHNMIKGMNVGESVDLELMKELIEKYGAYEYVDVGITNNGKEMTYKETVDLLNENEQLKQQLLYDGEDVCSICKHMYLISKGDYFIGKCKKGHEECSKEDIKYCEDFELKGDVE